MNEVWKDIDGYDDYQVSNMGRVKSLNYRHTGKEKVLRPGKTGTCYLSVVLYKNGKGKTHFVHRLVAEAFLINPYNLPCINHKDENPSNNHIDNLEFCSYQYNNTYGTARKRGAAKLRGLYNTKCSKILYQYTLEGEFIKEWPSVAEVERQMGFAAGHISQYCNGKRKTAYGYIWSYTELDEHSCKKKGEDKYRRTVYQFSLDGEFIREWRSAAEVKRQLGFDSSHISACCNSKRKTAYGYKWSYAS